MDEDDLILFGAATVFLQACYYIMRRRKRRHRWWLRPINLERSQQGFHLNLFRTLRQTDHEEFFAYTTMWPHHFDNLFSLVRPFLDKRVARGRRRLLHSELKLALTISYLAHGDSRRSKAWEFRIGRSTVHKVVRQVCKAIVEAMKDRYLPAPEEETWQKVADEYYRKFQFPNCVGAVDGKHIRIQAPPSTGSQKFFSVNLLAVCDANCRFLYVDAGQYGSFGDRGVWSSSELGKSLKDGSLNLPPPRELPGTDVKANHVFIGNVSFPLSANLLCPYGTSLWKPVLPVDERIFNYRLSRARNTIENTFGMLASRWRILNGSICCSLDSVNDLVMSLACLHNFTMCAEDYEPVSRRRYCPPHFIDCEEVDGSDLPGAWRMQRENSNLWRDITSMSSNNYEVTNADRNVFKAYFQSEAGLEQVPDQVMRVLEPENLNRI